MINIWYHEMHRRIKNGQTCNCEYYILSCMLTAKRKWKKQYFFKISYETFYIFKFRTSQYNVFKK